MIVGREKEIRILKNALTSKKAEFICVYGRIRIGKTFMINEVYKTFFFKVSGIYKQGMKDQIENFANALKNYGYSGDLKMTTWLSAFNALRQFILQSGPSKEKKVIFFDELSWMDASGTKFLPALENFWNDFLSTRDDIVFIVSASVSWKVLA